jgi:hypothetical protein
MCRDAKLMETFLAAKEQIGICGSIIDETIAEAALAQSSTWLRRVMQDLTAAVSTVETWMRRERRMEWVRPLGGCVSFTCRSTLRASTKSLRKSTKPMSGPGTGLRWTIASCVSASAGHWLTS